MQELQKLQMRLLHQARKIFNRMGKVMGEELPYDLMFAGLTGSVMKGALGRQIGNALPKSFSQTKRNVIGNASTIPIEMLGNKYSNIEQMILAD